MKKKKRKIAVVTGKRGGFGALMTLMRAINEDSQMELSLIVTDMHLSSFFGDTAREVEKEFVVSAKVDLRQCGDGGLERSIALGRCVSEMASTLSKIKPDIVVLLGDRGEVLSTAIAAMELNIPIAHILGGDVAGNRDGNRIHAITKLANIHFPSSKDSYKRILKLGEDPRRVFSFGSTYIDLILKKEFTDNKEVRKKYKIAQDEEYFICIQHPMTFQEDRSYKEMKMLLKVLEKQKTKTFIIYPCSDQGYEGTVKAINEFSDVPHFSIHKNIEALDFWGLMSDASLFIGNSSSGLMETPYFNLPAVNIGSRQNGRIRDMNVLDASPTPSSILKAIKKVTNSRFKKNIKNNFVFGKGDAGCKIARVLKNIKVDDGLLMKKITY